MGQQAGQRGGEGAHGSCLPAGCFAFVWLGSCYVSESSRGCTLFTSVAGGSCSGTIPLSASKPRTSLLFFTCSLVIWSSVFKPAFWMLKLVISLAKSLALMVIVGRKSASGRFSGTFKRSFISAVVFPPNSARSPLLRIRPK